MPSNNNTDGRFPVVEIHGGVHGKDTTIDVDGVRQKATTRIEAVFDVNDVVRIKTFQIGEVHIVAEIKDGFLTTVHRADVYLMLPGDEHKRELLASSEADSLPEALIDCARQIALNSEQAVPAGGTLPGTE